MCEYFGKELGGEERAEVYHAGIEASKREDVHRRFKERQVTPSRLQMAPPSSRHMARLFTCHLHAPMTSLMRQTRQPEVSVISAVSTLSCRQVDVIVATVAFGMGIDNMHVRHVVHYKAPQTMEQYYQVMLLMLLLLLSTSAVI